MMKTLSLGWLLVMLVTIGFARGDAAAAAEKARSKKKPVVAKTPDVDKDDADDFEKDKGPVDRKIHISGVMSTSLRMTWMDAHTLPDGTRKEDDRTFELEHVHVKLGGDLTRHLSWAVQPCVAHNNEFSVIEANFTYAFFRALQVTVGRFLLPFGQFNQRSLPGSFATVSRPLLFSSHEERTISYKGITPSNLFFTPRDDIGIELGGSVWLGESEKFQLSYSGYFTNGLRSVSGTSSRFWDDNNNGKQLGARATLGYFGDRLSASIGVSGLLNEWEKSLRQYAVGADAWIGYEIKPGRRINLRGEYIFMRREIVPTADLLKGDEDIAGLYVTLDGMILSWLGAFAQFDSLDNKMPRVATGGGIEDFTGTMNRYLFGLLFVPVGPLNIRLEYSWWQIPLGYPDAHRVTVQAMVVF